MIYTPKEEIQARITGLRSQIEKAGLDAALFHYKIDYYYLSGTMQDGFLFMPREGEPVLLIKRELARARRESPLEHIVPLDSMRDIVPYVRGMKKVGLQLDVLPYNTAVAYRELLSGIELANSSPLTKALRRKKSAFEITLMQKAASIAKKVYAKVPELLREGMREIELGGLLEAYAKPLGHEGLLRMRSLNYEAYTWHILSGRTGSIVSQIDSPMGGLGLSPAFPVGASMKKMRKGEPILVDFGVTYYGYHADLTRMYALGRMPEEFVTAYGISRDIHYRVLDRATKGATAGELFRYSQELADASGFSRYYLGYGTHKVKFLGHGIGIELSEFPYLAPHHDYPLEEGMTLAIEPKFVMPKRGATGIENTVLIEKDGYRILTDVKESITIV
jgi:Xaa-Pro dipeptidase